MSHASSMLPIFVPVAAVGGLIVHQAIGAHPAHSQPGHTSRGADKAVVFSTAHPGNPPALRGRYGAHLVPILTAINATADQKAKIKAIVDQFKPDIEPVMISYHKKRDEFLEAIITGQSAEEIMDKQCQLNELFDKITNEYCVMNLKVRKLLTAKQRDELQAYRRAQGWVK